MNDSLEHRLRDLFETIEARVVPQPLRDSSAPHLERAPRGLAVARAAALMIVVVVGIVTVLALSTRSRESVVDVALIPPTAVDAREFDARVTELCHELAVGRNGVEPRFATPEAYITAVKARRDVIDRFVDALAGLPKPSDAPDLLTAVIAEFLSVRQSLDDVEEYARAGRLDDAASAWQDVDPRIDTAISPLREHGASTCNQQGV